MLSASSPITCCRRTSLVLGIVLYFIIGLAGVVALTVGTLLTTHRLRTAWALVAASQAMWVIADLLWGVLDLTGRPTDASIADVLYVAGYVLLAVGLGSMLRSGTQDHDWGDIVDAGIIAVSAALVLWPVVFEPTLELGWSAATLVALAYSAGDVVLLALLAALFFEGGRRTISFSLMVVAVSLVFAADLVYYIPALADGAAVEPLTNAAWLAGYILFGAAGLHRSARAGVISSGPTVDSPLRRLRFLGVALLALPCGYLLDTFAGDGFSAADFRIFVIANTAVGVLVVLRTGLLLHAVERAQRAASLAQGRFESVFQSAGLGISITHRRRDGADEQRVPGARRLLRRGALPHAPVDDRPPRRRARRRRGRGASSPPRGSSDATFIVTGRSFRRTSR